MTLRPGYPLCILTRVLIAELARRNAGKKMALAALAALVPGAGFLYLWLTNSRLQGPEAGGTIWWHKFRIVHAAAFLSFSALAWQGNKYASVPLFADVAFSLVTTLRHRLSK